MSDFQSLIDWCDHRPQLTDIVQPVVGALFQSRVNEMPAEEERWTGVLHLSLSGPPFSHRFNGTLFGRDAERFQLQFQLLMGRDSATVAMSGLGVPSEFSEGGLSVALVAIDDNKLCRTLFDNPGGGVSFELLLWPAFAPA